MLLRENSGGKLLTMNSSGLRVVLCKVRLVSSGQMKNINTASPITVYKRYIFHDLAAGRIKFDRGPDLARGPDFGHACLTPCS